MDQRQEHITWRIARVLEEAASFGQQKARIQQSEQHRYLHDHDSDLSVWYYSQHHSAHQSTNLERKHRQAVWPRSSLHRRPRPHPHPAQHPHLRKKTPPHYQRSPSHPHASLGRKLESAYRVTPRTECRNILAHHNARTANPPPSNIPHSAVVFLMRSCATLHTQYSTRCIMEQS